jgi:DNA-binding FadR family transcriptional regulator
MTSETRRRATYQHRKRSLGSLTQQIVQDLGIAIVTGKFSGPEGFPIESEICARYDASRSIVREAIKVLNAKGLLTARPRRGTSVRPERDWNLLDPDVLYWMLKRRFSLALLKDFTRARRAIEPAAAAEAARTASEEQLGNIAGMLQRMRDAAKGKLDPLEADVEFHLSILEASNNPFFYNMSSVIETALRFSIRFTNRQLRQRFASVEEHEVIYNAIRDRDQQTAFSETQGLLDRALELMEANGPGSSAKPGARKAPAGAGPAG